MYSRSNVLERSAINYLQLSEWVICVLRISTQKGHFAPIKGTEERAVGLGNGYWNIRTRIYRLHLLKENIKVTFTCLPINALFNVN